MKKYGTDPELDKLVDSDDFEDRIKAAEQDYGLDKLINDENLDVRKAVAEQCYGLNKLIYDKAWLVRREVARQGYGLNRLIYDNDWHVRKAVAWQGYGLNTLITDRDSSVIDAVDDYLREHNYKSVFDWAKDNNVDISIEEWLNSDDWSERYRYIIAKAGYYLDILVNDENEDIRKIVAEQGYGLDKLMFDEDYTVRKSVTDYLKEHNYKSVFDWAKDNNVDLDIDEWLNSDDSDKREQVAKYGYRLDILINDKDKYVREEVAKQGFGLNILINDTNIFGALEAAKEYLKEHNYKSVFEWAKDNNVDINIDEWLNSNDWTKRCEVAYYGYKLDKLITDRDPSVSKAVYKYLREHNYNSIFDWARDNNVDINIDEWLNSDDWDKRCVVARQGYRLDKLVNDENEWVRTAVYDYLNEHNYKSIFDWAKDNNVDLDIDEWLNSDNWTKRYAVAKQGYGLNKLVNDENSDVRYVVAKQGYGLDKLVNDKDKFIFNVVYEYVKEHNYKSVFNWAKENNIDIDIDEWINSNDWYKRYEVAEQGYGLNKLIYDEHRYVRCAVYDYLKEHNYKSVLDWAKDNNVDVDLDEWLNSDDQYKRGQVAKYGYRLDKLINDKDSDIREVANDYLREHNYKSVFEWAKENNIDLDIEEWLNSDDQCKREQVAKQGYKLNKLVYDKDWYVCEAAKNYLKEQNLTIDEWLKQNEKIRSTIQNLKDFIYKVEDSSKIKVETSYDSVDKFFEDTTDESYEVNEFIVLITADTKIPLIKLEKNKSKNKNVFKFIVDIDEIGFTINNIFYTEEKFNQLLQSTIDTLREYSQLSKYSQFSKYVDELEQYL